MTSSALVSAWWAVQACVAPGSYGQPGEPMSIPTPAIDTFSLDCDPDAGRWLLSATTTGWTGGGLSTWSQDLVYLEQHVALVVASAPTPTYEEIELTLSIVSDWRDQTAGSSTVFTCGDDPNVAFTLFDVDEQVVDCRIAGPLAQELSEELDCAVATLPAP